MLSGSCLCGGVRYEIAGTLSGTLNCHCTMCRKAHGAAFRSRARVNAADFRWVQGEELVTYYESSPGTHRGFCRVCGSPLLSRFDDHPAGARIMITGADFTSGAMAAGFRFNHAMVGSARQNQAWARCARLAISFPEMAD